MSFLPEDDQDYLAEKEIPHILKQEGEKCGIIFPNFDFDADLYQDQPNGLIRCTSCDLLVLVPKGYNTTRLDSFYTRAILKKSNGVLPVNTTGVENHFDENWQFWSRHLTDEEWLNGSRGFDSYIGYIRAALRDA